MIRARLPFVAEAVTGERCGADVEISGVSVDSRSVEAGNLFVPLPGERAMGHEFVGAAMGRGATAFLWERRRALPPEYGDWPHVLVDDALTALQRLAGAYRRRLPVRIIGVTGSNGKTSTKEMIAAVLGADFATYKTPGNFNSHIGLPLALLSLSPTTEVAVLEMGMRGPGEIALLCELAAPEMGAVTNVHEAHMGRLGSREAIADAKWELIDALPEGGIAILPDNEPLLERALPAGVREVRFGTTERADVRMLDYRAEGPTECSFVVKGFSDRILLRAPGRHQATNALIALAVAEQFGVPREAAASRLSLFAPARMRMEVSRLESGAWLINDAYNASPASVRAALEVLRDLPAERRVAVLGDMLELGEAGPRFHRDIGAELSAYGVTDLVAVGEQAQDYLRGARGRLDPSRMQSADDAERASACALLALGEIRQSAASCAILVKGSRKLGLERVVASLRSQVDEAAPN